MKLFTVWGENKRKQVIDASVIKARGWKHAQAQADKDFDLHKYHSVTIHRHDPGSKQELCDSCDGVGLMEGWNHRDGASCPKCKGSGLIVMEKQKDGSFERYVVS